MAIMTIMTETHIQNRHYNDDNNDNHDTHIENTHYNNDNNDNNDRNKYKADIIKNGIYDNNDRTHIYNAH